MARKYIRIALTQDDESKLSEAKQKVEASTKVSMSDSLFVLSIIRRAISQG